MRIGARVLIPATEVERLCRKGTTLSGAEKAAALSDPKRCRRPRKHTIGLPGAAT